MGKHPFDEAMTKEEIRVICYPDDMTIMCRTKEEDERTLRKIEEWGIPVMAEMVPLSLLKSQYFGTKDKPEKTGRSISEEIKIISRVGAEHGADVIKTYFPGDIAGFREACRDATVQISMVSF